MREREDRMNWTILALASVAAAGFLWLATHGGPPIVRVGAALAFGFVANTIFALLHESVHGVFDRDIRANALAGRIAASWFPTSYTLQRAFHTTHHANNRSDVERFDVIGPGEGVVLKTLQWFTILTGLYWASAPVFAAFHALFGGIVPWPRLVKPETIFARQTSAGAFLGSLRAAPLGTVRVEVLAALAFQAGLFVLLDLSILGWLLAYAAFALMWSSLQYANHAFTVFDRIEGAWNLKAHPFTRAMFLNYHDHRAHHQDVRRRWQQLPANATGEVGLLHIIYRMWMGPVLQDEASAPRVRIALRDRTVVAMHMLVFGVLFLVIYGGASADYPGLAPYFDITLPIDAAIPFVPWTGLIYLSLNLLLVLTPIMLARPAATLPFLAAMVGQLIVAWFAFEMFPVALPPTEPVDPLSWGGWLYRLATVSNLDGNGLPSLHVAFALSCAWAIGPRLSPTLRLPLWLWALAICVSTLTTKQHYAVDAVAGALLAVATMGLAYPRLIAGRAAGMARLTPVATSG